MAPSFMSSYVGHFLLCIVVVTCLVDSAVMKKEASATINPSPVIVGKVIDKQGLQERQDDAAKTKGRRGLFYLFTMLGILSLWPKRRKRLSSKDVLRVCTDCWNFLWNEPSRADVFQRLADRLVNELGFAAAVLVRMDEAGQGQVVGLAPRSAGHTIPMSLPLNIKALLDSLPDGSQIVEGEALQAWLKRFLSFRDFVPTGDWEGNGWFALLTSNHRPLGLLILIRPYPFSPQEIALLEQLRQQVTVMLAISRERLTEASDRSPHDRLQRALCWLLREREVEQAETLDAKFEAVLRTACEVLGVTQVRLWRLDKGSGRSHCTLVMGEADRWGKEALVRPLDSCLHYLALLERERCLVVSDVRSDERMAELRPMLGEHAVALAAAPVWMEGKVVAVLECEDKRPRQWLPEEEEFLVELADLLARIWLEDRRQQRERYLETLSSIALQLLAVTEWQGAVPSILADLCTTLQADEGFIAQWSGKERMTSPTFLCHWGIEGNRSQEGLEQFLRVCLSDQQVSTLEQGEAVTFTSSILTNGQRAQLKGLSWQSLLILPLLVESRLWGILGFVQTHYERIWSDMDIAVLRIASALLGSAIERQLASERQLDQERQFRDLFENAVVGIYRGTPAGRFLIANRTLAHIKGCDDVDELMALNIPEQFYANLEDREQFKRLMEEQGVVADLRYPIRRKDGSLRWVAEWARAVKDEAGQVRYYEGFVLDITEQVLLSQWLQSLQGVARALVTPLNLQSVLAVATQELNRLYPNSAIIILQYCPERRGYLAVNANALGREWLNKLGQDIGEILTERPFHPLEQRLRRGETIIADVSANPVLLGQAVDQRFRVAFLKGLGTLSEFWGILVVLHERAEFLEHERAFLNSFCDYLSIAIRNATLFQQLQQAYQDLQGMQHQMMEQERLRALGQMASGIVHDINNALVPIQGFAELLLEHDDPTVQNAAQVIFKAARDIATVVQRMREFYRPRAKDELLEPLDINTLCKDALEMTRPRWHNIPQERGVVIEPLLELSNDLPPVVGISNEVRQAIVNLILNAADAMPHGGTLTLRTYRAERNGHLWAVVEVSDTGIGMDEETRRRAVEPFFTTKGEKGSGLGLSVVYGTMQRHEGLLEIESEPGKGTTVRLWFPSKEATTETASIRKVPPMRLLVIDDEPYGREMVANLLRRDGHWVVTAADGEQGLHLFEAALSSGEPFDAVITDLGMPRLDGFSVARAVKNLSPSTPVVLLSGWGFRLRETEMEALVDKVLTKPATHQQLRNALYDLTRRLSDTECVLNDGEQ